MNALPPGTSEGTGGTAPAAAHARPLLRVVRGDPSPEELAALIAVVTARSAGGEAPAAPPPSRWAAPGARLRTTLRVGPGAWWASALPR